MESAPVVVESPVEEREVTTEQQYEDEEDNNDNNNNGNGNDDGSSDLATSEDRQAFYNYVGFAKWLQEIEEIRRHAIHNNEKTGEWSAMNEIIPKLFLGNVMSAKSRDKLKASGIEMVINCAGTECDTRPRHSEFPHYLELPADDEESYMILEQHYEVCKDFILSRTKFGNNGEMSFGILIHCVAGMNRSATITVALQMDLLHWPLLKAIRHTSHQRPYILSNKGFLRQLIYFASKRNLLS